MIAFCLIGSVSRQWPQDCGLITLVGDPSEPALPPYVDFRACAESIKNHIFNANPGCQFDVFAHCWNSDLEHEIREIYSPVSAQFDSNKEASEEIYEKCNGKEEGFNNMSAAISRHRCMDLVEKKYDAVIFYRYDVMLWKDIKLEKYPICHQSAVIYVNGHPGGNGDFHFIMSYENALKFAKLDESGLEVVVHQWIRKYVTENLDLVMAPDDIFPGTDNEVMRKVKAHHHQTIQSSNNLPGLG